MSVPPQPRESATIHGYAPAGALWPPTTDGAGASARPRRRARRDAPSPRSDGGEEDERGLRGMVRRLGGDLERADQARGVLGEVDGGADVVALADRAAGLER